MGRLYGLISLLFTERHTKLQKYGIHGNLLAWFANYLFNRSQSVFVDGTYSSKQYITAGVPQGLVLGPMLFLIYICSAQSRNRYHSGIVLRKVGILTLLRKVGILTLRKTIPELSLRKVRIGTK